MHGKSSQEPNRGRNNKLITTEASGLSPAAVCPQTPATPETLARIRGGGDRCLFKNQPRFGISSQRFLRYYQREMIELRVASPSLPSVCLAGSVNSRQFSRRNYQRRVRRRRRRRASAPSHLLPTTNEENAGPVLSSSNQPWTFNEVTVLREQTNRPLPRPPQLAIDDSMGLLT